MGKQCAHKTVMILGIFELLLSLAIIGSGIFDFVLNSYLNFIAHGIWGGALLALTSVFAITAGCFEKTSLHVTHMIFAILSCVFIIPSVNTLFGIETTEHSRRNFYVTERCYNCYNSYESYGYGAAEPMDCSDCKTNTGALKNELIAMGICGLLFIILIISASFTCCAICSCCGAQVTNGVVYPNQQDGVVIYSHPLQQQTLVSTQLQQQYPTAYYPVSPNNAYEQNQLQQLQAAPPAYGQATFSAALAGQAALDRQPSFPISKAPDATSLYT